METLSQREIQVADLIHQGFIEKEIAVELSISSYTVHLKNIRRKLSARNIADITRIFINEIKSNMVEIILALLMIYFISKDPTILENVKAAINHFK